MLSLVRILCTLSLFFVKPLSPAFFVLYTISGATDVLDGVVARAFGWTSELGAALDSVADLSFYGVMLIRMFPVLWALLAGWVWLFGLGVVALRLCAYLTAAAKFHRFAAIHTYLNKATGFAVFSIPYLISLWDPNAVCATVCLIGAVASGEELWIHLANRCYNPNQRSIFQKGQEKQP